MMSCTALFEKFRCANL